METKEILKKVRRIEIKTQGLVNHLFSGEYHSAFKGRGMSFSEVREYHFGDEVRFIDWNVSARMDRPYLKVFEEEREQTVLLLFDASGSNSFGTQVHTKRELMVEIAAVMAFSAIQNNDKVGLMIFTDQVEKYIPPKKGRSHVLRLIRELLAFTPKSKKTNISGALEYAFRAVSRRSIIFTMSDFLDRDFETPMKTLAKKHDVVGVQIYDEREVSWPALGLVALQDEETGTTIEVDTRSKEFQEAFGILRSERQAFTEQLFKKCKVDLISIETGSDFIPSLVRFFKKREHRR